MSDVKLGKEINVLIASGEEEEIYRTLFHFIDGLKKLQYTNKHQYRILEAVEWILEGEMEDSMSEVYNSIDHVVSERMSEIKEFIKASDNIESKRQGEKDLDSIVVTTLIYRKRISEYFECSEENVYMTIEQLDKDEDDFGPTRLTLTYKGNVVTRNYDFYDGVEKFLELYLDDNGPTTIIKLIESATNDEVLK